MAEVTRNGQYSFTGATEVLNGSTGKQLGGSLKFYLVTVKDAGNSAVNITGEDDADGEVFEKILRLFDGVQAYDSVGASGLIYIIADSHAAPDSATLEASIRALGTSVGPNTIDVSGSTVVDGVSFTVSAS
jgi:hypothetical protein